MNKADVITKLEAEGAVKIFEGRSTEVKNGEGAVVHKLIPIFYFTQLDTNVLSERKSFELIEQDGVVDYHKSIPNILRPDPPVSSPSREPHFNSTELPVEIEKHYPLAGDGSFTITIQGEDDKITARVVDKDGKVTTKSFIAYDDKGTFVLKEVK